MTNDQLTNDYSMKEIEHKYLIKRELWNKVKPHKSLEIKQAYLHSDPDKTIRVRTMGNKAFVTIKGKTSGASRLEFEYEIPYNDAVEMISHFCFYIIEKIRHYVTYEGKLWEVDEFLGSNQGLFVAEIELEDESDNYKIPDWADKNVTDDVRYMNSNLCIKPYTSW